MNCIKTWVVHWGGHVATRDCEFFPVFLFLFFHVLLCVKLVYNQYFCYRAWSSFLLAFFHMRILSVILVSVSRYVIVIRELKIETFSGRRRPDWQSKPGTEAAVASLQNSNIKIAVNSGGRRLGRLPKRKIWLHIKN